MKSKVQDILEKIPILTVHAGPKDEAKWAQRLKEEYKALMMYIKENKSKDNDWFKLTPKENGTKWEGTVTYVHDLVRYTFKLQFEIPANYPSTLIELQLPELEGKTVKMYRGGKICQDIHFAPLWREYLPKLGIAHALALSLGPWLAAEIPNMIAQGTLKVK